MVGTKLGTRNWGASNCPAGNTEVAGAPSNAPDPFFIFHFGPSGRAFPRLWQLRVLGLGLLQDGDVGVSVFPAVTKS
jgi:hypothetical protein